MRNLISLADCTAAEIMELLDLAARLKAEQKAGKPHRLLEGRTLAMIFEKPSLRTRVTFEAGMVQLGGHAILIETRLGERESAPDVARNLARWVDAIAARTFRHEDVLTLAEHARVPVINALTDMLHPCQILADAQTLREHKGAFDGLRIAFVGDGNNVFASWANFAAHFPIELLLVCPPGYEGDLRIVNAARERGGRIDITNDLAAGVDGADVVYTDVWTSMGQEDEAEARIAAFRPYQVNAEVMGRAKPDALFMHCLPAKRGQEVTDDVMDGPRSVVFDEAENRLHAQKAVLVKLLGAG